MEGCIIRIGIDIDGVVADIDLPILRLIDTVEDKEARKNIDKYYYSYRKVELDPQLISNFTGDKVILITGRPEWLRDITIDWLRRNKIRYDKLIICDHAAPFGQFSKEELDEWFKGLAIKKAEVLKREGIEVYFEDTPDTVKWLRELCPNIKIIQYGLRDLKQQ